MIVGTTTDFAIETTLTKAYKNLGFFALGSFTLHVAGCRYGVNDPEATMLACSIGAIELRLQNRGRHTAPFIGLRALEIAKAIRTFLYIDDQQSQYLGLTQADFGQLLHDHNLVWAPDGDAAFDDGSMVLQFDEGDNVRIIAFQSDSDGPMPDTLRQTILLAADFYGLLQQWLDAITTQWNAMPKT